MPCPNEETIRKCALIKGRFTGDPSHEYEHSEKNADDDGQDEEPNVVRQFLSKFLIGCFIFLKNILQPLMDILTIIQCSLSTMIIGL